MKSEKQLYQWDVNFSLPKIKKGGDTMRMYVTTEDVLWLAGAIVAISAAIKVVCGAIEQFRKPNKTQDARIAELERKAVNDYNRLNQLEEGNIITQRALLALLAHGIDGNDIEAMRKAKAELTDYLIER